MFVRVYLNTRLERFYMIKEKYVFEQQHVLLRYYVTHDYNMLSYYSKSLFLRGHYEQAHKMQPNLIAPLFAQFCIYKTFSCHSKTIGVAQKVVSFTPKVDNESVRMMKREAMGYLEQYQKSNFVC